MKTKYIISTALCGLVMLFSGINSQAQSRFQNRDYGCMSCPVAKTNAVQSYNPAIINRTDTIINRQKDINGDLVDRQWTDTNGTRIDTLILNWDTVLNCKGENRMIELIASTVVAAEHFNGFYKVEEIPYCPPHKFDLSDMDHHEMLPYTADDVFDANHVPVDFPFQFFGYEKSTATVGPNGVVTFDTRVGNGSSSYCPYQIQDEDPLPWVPGGNGYANTNGMIDAIYCIFEDLDPGYLTSWQSSAPAKLIIPGDDPLDAGTTRGTYKGYMDSVTTYPCRHVCFSWNGVPTFSCGSSDSSYHTTKQLVIYEGTNIIEFHVKKRVVCTTWEGGYGLIGIENATGLPQESHAEGTPYYNTHPGEVGPDDPLYWITPNAPPSFAVDYNTINNTMGDTWNKGNTSITERAWRFTPQGATEVNFTWYKVTDTADIPIYWNRNEYTSPTANYPVDAYLGKTHEDATKLFDTISIYTSEPGTYKLHYYFQVPVGDVLLTYGTENELDAYITVGIDTNHTTRIITNDQYICQGANAALEVTYPDNQIFDSATWIAYQIIDGQRTEVPQGRLTATNHGKNLTMSPLALTEYRENTIDTTLFIVNAQYNNGCSGTAEIYMYAFPNFEFFHEDGICDGEEYVFDGRTFTTTNHDIISRHQSVAGCDSVDHMDLTVFDIQYVYDDYEVCDSLVWNGRTFYKSNTTTSSHDTVHLINQYGCDSVSQLRLTVRALEPRILASPDFADFDHMTIQLTDVSINGSERVWTTQDGFTSNNEQFYYNYPSTYDSVKINLHAVSDLGCEDDTSMYIHLIRESLWAPNAFAPGEDVEANKVFKPMGTGITSLECYIYNRQGELVYTFKDMDDAWDGNSTDGKTCPQGVYVYLIRYTNNIDPNRLQVKKGTVTLLR